MRAALLPGIVSGVAPEISPLDPTAESDVAAVQALRVAAEAVDIPDFPPPCPYSFRAELTHPVSHKRTEWFVARAGGVVAGCLSIALPLKENLDNVEADLLVHPAHRRRGIGRTLYAYLVERMRELGRKRWTTMTVEALPGGPFRDGAGPAFAAGTGAKAALDDVRRRLDLTTADLPALAALAESARSKAAGYRLVTWQGRTPEEYLADVAYLESRLDSDAPLGELAWEPHQAEVARVREREDMLAAGGRRVYSAGAVHEPTRRLVALTAMGQQRTSLWHAFQWITLVDPPHRGHRLGALVKAGNLRLTREQEPALRVVDTWNAAVNRHMISINEAMGFRPVDVWVNWQQEV